MTSSASRPDRLTHPESPDIRRVEADQREAALRRLLASHGDADEDQVRRFQSYASENRISLEHLWSWFDDGGRILDTVLAVPNPGRTAMFFASQPLGDGATSRLATLLDHVARSLDPEAIHLAQALLDPSEISPRRALLAGGFTELARLSYLERRTPRRTRAVDWPPEIDLQPYRDEIEDDFLRALDETYVDTLDCPALGGLRETRDVLRGHRGSGVFEAALWTLLRVKREPKGVLLFNGSAAHRSLELVYLGLAPSARGRGLGRKLLVHGLNLLTRRRERTITLAVDEQNAPALRLYEAEGFRRAIRRVALIRPLRNVHTSFGHASRSANQNETSP